MIIELNNIKEVEITAKTEFKYYLLFSYNNNSKDPNFRYFLIDQNPDIDWIKIEWMDGIWQKVKSLRFLRLCCQLNGTQ